MLAANSALRLTALSSPLPRRAGAQTYVALRQQRGFSTGSDGKQKPDALSPLVVQELAFARYEPWGWKTLHKFRTITEYGR